MEALKEKLNKRLRSETRLSSGTTLLLFYGQTMKAKGHAGAPAGRKKRDASVDELRGEIGGRETWKKLPPHLLGRDVRAAAVSCHLGPQSSGAEAPPGSLPPSLQSHSQRAAVSPLKMSSSFFRDSVFFCGLLLEASGSVRVCVCLCARKI